MRHALISNWRQLTHISTFLPWMLLSLLNLLALLVLGSIVMSANATDIKPLDDKALSDVRGGDGLSFAANLNVNIGSIALGITDSASNPATLAFNKTTTTGIITSTLDVFSTSSNGQTYINWAFPLINGANTLQYGYDLSVLANGNTLGTGIQFQDIGFGGSSVQLTSNDSGGVSWGLGLNLNIGSLQLQPNGRGNTSGQMAISGVVMGAAGSNGTAPWVLADINTQPGIVNIVNDASGNPELQLGIGWASTPGAAASGSLQIGNITFTTPNGNVNLGSSSIGSMQIQYLNVRLKP